MKNFKIILICLAVFFFVFSCAKDKSISNKIDSDPSAQNIIETAPIPPPEPVMVVYEGRILNIFFHPLVARPETAFKSKDREHFIEWYLTASEYRKVLYELYINDYVLIDVKELYEVNIDNGIKTMIGKKPLIPEGKKPMILSIDDLSYYDFVRETASIHKLVIDGNNNIAGWTPNETETGELSYDLDVVTYLEEFIKKYPDFSIRGAKGIIALTGYEGVLGYWTHELNAPNYQETKEQAIAVVNRLKELGWHFASHSWGHPNMPNISMAWYMNDTNRWDREVRPVIGDTDLFIYPFGAGVEAQEDRHRVLRDRNFNVFFGVGSGYTFTVRPQYVYFDRRNIDGFYFRTFRNRDDRLFDIENVIDEEARRIR